MSLEPSYTIVGLNYWPEPTGNAPYNTDLAEELSQSSVIHVLTGIPHYPWWEKQRGHSDLEYDGLHPNLKLVRLSHTVPKTQSNVSRAIMEISFGFSAILSGKLSGPKVILVSPAMLSSAMVLAWLRLICPKTKVLVWVQDLYEQGLRETSQKKGILSAIIASIENWMLANSDRVVVAHPKFLKAKQLSQINTQKYFTVPNWSQFEFSPTETSSETKSRYSFGDAKLVLHIGNMGVKQGLENVLETARLAQSLKHQVTFAFVGGGNQLDRLKVAASDLENVMFIPPVSESELANLLQAADILLVNEKPGVKEMSIPSKLTTYFLSGRPVLVCSEPDSLAGMAVIENKTGLWVQSGNPDDLLTGILRLEPSEAEIVAKTAILFAREKLSKESALRQFRQILDHI